MEPTNLTGKTNISGTRRRARRALLCGAVLTAALAAPSAASAADTVIAPDTAANQMTALDGTIVWVSGEYGEQTLWQKNADGVARVKGAPQATAYRTIDLGRNSKNKLVLTYQRCNASSCKSLNDDLKGHRKSFKHLTIKRCFLTTSPARWRERSAYGLECQKPNGDTDEGRSGVYVKTGSKAPKRLPRPHDAKKFHMHHIESVDLRGEHAAALLADVYEYAFVQTVEGKKMRSIFAAGSEGDDDQRVPGLALGPGGTMWALTQAAHGGDPNLAIVFRVANTCYDHETMVGQVDSEVFPASDIAVDGSTVYLVVPGTGIVTHEFTPADDCSPL